MTGSSGASADASGPSASRSARTRRRGTRGSRRGWGPNRRPSRGAIGRRARPGRSRRGRARRGRGGRGRVRGEVAEDHALVKVRDVAEGPIEGIQGGLGDRAERGGVEAGERAVRALANVRVHRAELSRGETHVLLAERAVQVEAHELVRGASATTAPDSPEEDEGTECAWMPWNQRSRASRDSETDIAHARERRRRKSQTRTRDATVPEAPRRVAMTRLSDAASAPSDEILIRKIFGTKNGRTEGQQ